MKHTLLQSGKYLNKWGFCCDSGRYCHATKIEHLTKFELKPSILNHDVCHSLYVVCYMCACVLACFVRLARWLERLVKFSTLSALECDNIMIRNYNMASEVGSSPRVHYYICEFQRKFEHKASAQPRFSSTPTTTNMAELAGLPIPHMDWSSSNAP